MTGNTEVMRSPVGLVPINAQVLTEPVNSRMVGDPEVTLRPDLFGGQVVKALFIAPDYRKLAHCQKGRRLF
jgi:hypothetical protein